MQILLTSLSSSILILLIFFLRAAALYKLPKRAFVCLWTIALFRLFLFFSIPSHPSQASGWNVSAFLSRRLQTLPPFYDCVFHTIWIIGAFSVFFSLLILHKRSCRKYACAKPAAHPAIQKWLLAHPLKRKIQVKTLDTISSALTYQVMHPILLLPSLTNLKNAKELEYMLAHEYVHIKRFDLLYKWILVIALSLHWFNPLVWLLYFFANRDLELACDEEAVALLGNAQRASYARFLLKIGAAVTPPFSPIPYMAKHPLEERIVSLMRKNRHTKLSAAIALLLICLFCLAGCRSLTQSTQELSQLNDQRQITAHGGEGNIDTPTYEEDASGAGGDDEDYKVSYVLKNA